MLIGVLLGLGVAELFLMKGWPPFETPAKCDSTSCRCLERGQYAVGLIAIFIVVGVLIAWFVPGLLHGGVGGGSDPGVDSS
jgi:hypothetical protein